MPSHNFITRVQLALTKISPASWIYHLLGSAIVASPKELKQAPHFWFDNEDRPSPTPSEYGEPVVQLNQVASDDFRRRLRKGLAWYAFVVSSVLCVAIYVIGLGLGKTNGIDTSETGAPGIATAGQLAPTPQSCDELKSNYYASLAARGKSRNTVDDLLTANERKIKNQFQNQCN